MTISQQRNNASVSLREYGADTLQPRQKDRLKRRRRSSKELHEKSVRRKRSLREETYQILRHTPNLSASEVRQRWRNRSLSTGSVWINKSRSKGIIRTVSKLGESKSGGSRRSTRQQRKAEEGPG